MASFYISFTPMLLRLVVLLLLCAGPAFAEIWTNFATIEGPRSALVICKLDSSVDDLQCPVTNPVIDASGHVGIGTASPARLLEIASGSDIDLFVGKG
jgi:hypothetical protein